MTKSSHRSLGFLFALSVLGASFVVGPAQADAPACSLDGTWTFTVPSAAGPIAGQPGKLEVRGARATVTFGEPTMATVQMRARIEDGVLKLNDQRSTPANLRCTDAEPGQYRLEYDAACGTVRLELLDDGCTGRRSALSGASLTRRP
jgi:hypothetical protein